MSEKKQKKHHRKSHRSRRGRPRTNPAAPSLDAAAGRMGIPLDVLKAAKRAGCPAFTSNGRVNVDGVAAWLAERPEFTKELEAAPNLMLERALAARADREMKQHKLAVMKEEYIPREHVKISMTRSTITARVKITNAIKTVCRTVGPMNGLTQPQLDPIERALDRAVYEALVEMSKDWPVACCWKCGAEQPMPPGESENKPH